MKVYEFNKKVHLSKIQDEIKEKLNGLHHIDYLVEKEIIQVHFENVLGLTDFNTLDKIVVDHIDYYEIDKAREKRIEAENFGSELYNQFIDENILLDIVKLGLSSHVRKTMSEVKETITSGLLYDALEEISFLDDTILDETILTETRLLTFRNKVEDYLVITKSTKWNETPSWLL